MRTRRTWITRAVLVVMLLLALTTSVFASNPTDEPGSKMIECPDCGTSTACMVCYGPVSYTHLIRSFGLLRPGVRGTLISIIPYLLIKNKKERCKHFVKVDDAAPSPVFFPGFLSFRPFSSDPRNLTLPLPAGL